jgi:hypothetical protein
MPARQLLPVFFGHHKCASSWLERVSREVCRELKLHFEVVYEARWLDTSLAEFVKRRQPDFLVYANADYADVQGLGDLRGFHVVRDPRDVCVSAYFSHRSSHPTDGWPELVEHRRRLLACSKDEGLLLEMEFRREHFAHMRSWPDNDPRILELKMEDLVSRPYEGLLQAFGFLGLVDDGDFTPGKRLTHVLSKGCRRLEHWTGGALSIPVAPARLSAERMLGIAWELQFARLSGGRTRGQEDTASHYRKGTPGDWRNHFTPRHVAFFREHYDDLLYRYAYETDPDWGLAPPAALAIPAQRTQ